MQFVRKSTMLCKSIERGNLVVGESGMEKETMMQSYMEQHLMSIPELEVGQIVTGTVVQTNDETVLVDIGYKSEGQVPVDEFIELPKIGDKVALTILKLDNGR